MKIDFFEKAKEYSKISKKEIEKRIDVVRDRFTVYGQNNTASQNFDLLMEAMILSQMLIEFAKASVKQDAYMEQNEEIGWVIPPKGDNQDFWLDKFGQRIWYLGDTTKSAHRSYYWCNRVVILDKFRKVLEDIKFSDFINRIDVEGWIPEIPDVKINFNKE